MPSCVKFLQGWLWTQSPVPQAAIPLGLVPLSWGVRLCFFSESRFPPEESHGKCFHRNSALAAVTVVATVQLNPQGGGGGGVRSPRQEATDVSTSLLIFQWCLSTQLADWHMRTSESVEKWK